MNLKKLMKKLRKNKNALDVKIPKIPTKKQVVRSKKRGRATDPPDNSPLHQ